MKSITKEVFFICILIGVLGIGFLFLGGYYILNPEVCIVEGEQNYMGRSAYFEGEEEDLVSHLLVFPEKEYETLEIESYYFKQEMIIFLSSYDIFLSYTLEEQEYLEEKQRIENISMNYKNERQKIQKAEGILEYEVYVASWLKDRAYEYVLLDDENHRVVCVYSQLDEPDNSVVSESYRIEETVMKGNFEADFSIYYFDDGKGAKVLPELGTEEVKSTWYPN